MGSRISGLGLRSLQTHLERRIHVIPVLVVELVAERALDERHLLLGSCRAGCRGFGQGVGSRVYPAEGSGFRSMK